MDNKAVFAIMCILFNAYGVPCFMQGKKNLGLKRILFGFITLGVLAIVNAVKGIILGVNVLKMTDEEFAEKKYTLDNGIPVEKKEA